MQQERKFAQICNLNRILHKYEAIMEICQKICSQKFAQICNQNVKFSKCFALIIDNINIICDPKFCPFGSISNHLWDKCKFMFFQNFWNFQKCFAVTIDLNTSSCIQEIMFPLIYCKIIWKSSCKSCPLWSNHTRKMTTGPTMKHLTWPKRPNLIPAKMLILQHSNIYLTAYIAFATSMSYLKSFKTISLPFLSFSCNDSVQSRYLKAFSF